jgi:hypothetical protein
MTITDSTFALGRIVWIGLLVGFLLNLSGWLGNNFLLGAMWETVIVPDYSASWRGSLWREVFSLLPDFLYGMALVWLCARLRPLYSSMTAATLRAGIFVSLVGGLTTYFAIANSGFIMWPLAFASFVLVLATKLPLAYFAGRLLES